MNIFSQDVISFPPYSSRIEFFVFVAIFLSLAAFTLISLDPLPFSIPSKYTREKDKEKKIEKKKFHYTLVTNLYKFIFHLHSNAVSNFHSN